MWLETPSPAPSPINVNVTVSIPPITVPPDIALDTYTGVLAAATIFLAAFTIGLAYIGWRALKLQGREIKATEKQLELANKEFERARTTAYPRLEVEADYGINLDTPNATIKYQWGTEPAFNVEVWVRDQNGSYGWQYGTIPAAEPPARVGVPEIPNEMLARWAFPELDNDAPLEQGDFWAGITWRCADSSAGRYLYRYDAANAEGNAAIVVLVPVSINQAP